MACMEHWCPDCDFAEFNNQSRTPEVCPVCGSRLRHFCDEAPEPDRDYDDIEDDVEEDEDYDDD